MIGQRTSDWEPGMLAMLTNFSTDLGYMALATWGGEVVGLTFGHSRADQAIRSLKSFHAKNDIILFSQAIQENSSEASFFNERVAQLLKRFSAGEPVDFDDITVSLSGMTHFQKRVVTACRGLGWGETASYGELAVRVGHPGAARAVGTVMRKNRVPLIVPCHRVLAAGGQLGGFSAPAGLTMKRRLLALEEGVLGKHKQSAVLF
jgi:methylated-DNA-[protein]-cysteine S-methyltransferase